MGDTNKKVCRFCLKTKHRSEIDIIEEITRQMLAALLLKLTSDLSKETVMCLECATKLQNAVDFKTSCLKIENKMLPSVISEENGNLALREDSLKENKNAELFNTSEYQKICRFCMKVAQRGGYTYLQENKEHMFMVDMVRKHIPELQLSATEEIVTCQACLGSLQSLLSLIMNCWDAEDIKGKLDETHDECELKLNDVKDVIMMGDVSCNDVKMETVLEKNDGDIIIVKDEIKDESVVTIESLELSIKDEEIESFQESTLSSQLIGETVYQCDRCPYKTNCKSILKQHTLDHSEVYKCERCSFKTKYKRNLKSHNMTHLDLSEVIVYKCERCSFKTKRKYSLKNHVLTHLKLTETKVYKCGKCLFETKYKASLKSHMVIHQKLSHVKIYKCDRCPYTVKDRYSIRLHEVTHQDNSESLYKCEMCSFETKHRYGLKTHMYDHMQISGINMYKCERCPYKAKRKHNLNKHMLTHKDPSELISYKCEKCTFETKSKCYLKQHMLTHKELSEVTVYQCDMCPYQSKYKCTLKQHVLVHLDISEVTSHKCQKCSFMTKHKRSLKKHMLIHQEVMV